ncbi:hypothetical protein RIF29_36494 [Crotalaria pallida]|uniref:Uncharacterized protein n=1 Tax=Crotalaria pallida TaxID=3830 RepID=A0AAN9EGQ7_CROPI
MKPPKYKVKTKGGVKGSRKEAAHEKSTKREPSHWENDVMEGAYPSNGSESKTKGSQPTRSKTKGSQSTASAAAARAAARSSIRRFRFDAVIKSTTAELLAKSTTADKNPPRPGQWDSGPVVHTNILAVGGLVAVGSSLLCSTLEAFS